MFNKVFELLNNNTNYDLVYGWIDIFKKYIEFEK